MQKKLNAAGSQKLMNKAVIAYAGLFITYRAMDILTPFHELFEQAGSGILPKLVGLAGALLLAADLITTRTVLRCAHVKWILFLLMTLVLSSVVRYQYNDATEVIKYIVYISAEILLLFSMGIRMRRQEQQRFLKALHTAVSAVFVPALCYMFWQFITQQHYITHDDIKQGWYDGRLYGVMRSLYHGGLFISVIAFVTVFLMLRSKRKKLRILYAAELIICVVYIALSSCRTAYVACAAGIGTIIIYRCFRGTTIRDRDLPKKLAKGALLYIAVLVIMFACISGIRSAGFYLVWQNNIENSEDEQSFSAEKKALDRPEQKTFSSGRAEIWRTYGKILLDKPSHLIFGLSYNGHSEYIRKHYPDTFIISYFKEVYSYAYRKGFVYDAHNSYLFVLIAAGIPGLLALLGFLFNCAKDVIGRLLSGRMTAYECMLMAIIAMLLVAAMFEANTFISVAIPPCVFWLTSGLLIEEVQIKREGQKDEKEQP